MAPPPSEMPADSPKRISWRILPGSSSVSGLIERPWKRASVWSVPSARSGSTIIVIHEVSSESRPNSVMNHGAPAATTARSGWSGSNIRSAARSSVDRASSWPKVSWSEAMIGSDRRQAASRSTGVARSTGTSQR